MADQLLHDQPVSHFGHQFFPRLAATRDDQVLRATCVGRGRQAEAPGLRLQRRHHALHAHAARSLYEHVAARLDLVFDIVTGNVNFAEYLGIPYVAGSGEILVFCSALAGAGLGFLWFNTYPAQVFMGDIGALALGAALGVVAVVVRQEIVLAIMGGVFVVETLSVMIQVASYKLTGKRVFRMAPLHHHFELLGWTETQVVIRFWIIAVVFALAGLSTLKLR